MGCVGVARTIRKEGGKVAMVNYNPETVSTDYDESDRLYFEELSLERVLDIVDLEQPTKGTVVSVGGQIPNGLCMDLYNNNVKVLGTCPTDIDSAEDRSKFSALCDANGIVQPAWRTLSTLQEVKSFVSEVGYPILARPSYVLSGGGMQVVFDDAGLEQYLGSDSVISADFPVVVVKFSAMVLPTTLNWQELTLAMPTWFCLRTDCHKRPKTRLRLLVTS